MLKGFFAGSSSTPEVGADESSTRSESGSESASPTDSASPSPSATVEVKAKPKDTYPLKLTLHHAALPPLTTSEKAESKTRCVRSALCRGR